MKPSHYRKTVTGFAPVSAAAQEFHAKTRLDQIIELKGRRPRNPGHHRKAFALLRIVADNNEQFTCAEDALIAVKAAVGHGRWVEIEGATKDLFIPDSIDFASMPQDEFEVFYAKMVAAVQRYFLPVADNDLAEAVASFAA